MAFRDKPNNDFTESKPIHATVMLLDLFDTDRLDRRGVKLYHEMLPNEVGYPLNRHAVYYSDSILRQSDIIVPDIVPSNFGVKSSAIKESDVLMSSTPTGLQTADKRILLMTIWEDNETDYVMHVSMDAIFMLLAIKTLQTPVSPYEFFKTFQSKADTVKTETNRFNPVIKYPELGNIHNYNDMENESFKFPIAEQVEGQPIILETKSDHIPLGMVPSVYSEFKEPLRELETLFTPNETFDLFNGIYQTIQKAQKDLQDKIELAKQTRPSYEDGTLMSDPEIITDLTLKEDAIFMGYSLIDADFHNKFLYSDISMGQWWRPRCNTNMLKHPIFMVDEAYRNEKIFVTNSQGEKEPTIVTKVVKGNQSVEHLLKQLEPDMHDIPLLSNTWAFLPDLEEFKKSATLPKDVDDLKKIDLPPDVIPRSEYADRSRANDNFNLVIEQSMFNAACDFYEGGIYSNLCVMAMFMLTKRFPLDSTSLCKKLTTWFCTKFAPFSLAYQIPNDLFEPAMYRTYDEKENLARRQKLGKEKEIKPQNIALNINEENAPIYVNEDLMFDLKQHKTLWLYYYSTIIGPEATTKLLKSLKIKENTEDEEETKHTKKPQQETGEDENIENLTEDDDKDKDTIEELNENDYVKIFENYKSYSDGDVRAKTIRWPWASKEKAANDVKETDANELQKLNSDPLYNKHSKNGVSELVITMNGPDTAVFEEIRLFRGINLSEEMNNILRKNNNQGDVYYYRNYPFIPFLNQEAKSFTRNVIYPSKTLEIIEPFLFINTDEQTLYEIQKYNASPLPEPRVYDLAGDVKQYITITDVTNMMDVDEPTPPVVEPKEEEQVPVKPKEDMMDIVKPEEKPKQEEIPVVKPQDTMDIVKPKQEIPNNLLTLLDTYQKRMENVFKDDLPVFTNFFTWLQKIVEQFQSTTMVAIFNMVKQRGGLLNETAPSKLYTSLQKLGIWVNNSTIVAELRQEFITHYSLDWTTYLNDLKTHWHLIVHETVSQFNPTIYTFLSKKLMTMASHLYLILSVCYDDVNTLQATILDNPDATEQELDMAGIIDEELPFLDSVFELFNTGSMTIYKFIPMISEEMVAKSWPVELEEDKGKRDRERKRQELLAKRQARTTNQ